VRDVADDRDLEIFDLAFVAADRRGIEQRLGRVLVLAVAGVDDRALRGLREQRRCAAESVANDARCRSASHLWSSTTTTLRC